MNVFRIQAAMPAMPTMVAILLGVPPGPPAAVIGNRRG